jgi:hypothetical protein
MKNLLLLLLIVVLISGCQQVGEFYAGMDFQPKLSRDDFKPGLNVYGVLKTGAGFDTLNQYFEVEKIVFIKESYDSIYVDRAEISLTRCPVVGSESVYRLNHLKDGVYLNAEITTVPGDRWLYKCSYDTFEVTSACTIPNTPVLKKAPEIMGDHSISFTVQSDSTACMYDIYLLNGEHFFFSKKVPLKGVDTNFNLNPEWDTTTGTNLIYIFAYDENLEKYYTTSNTFFKPNAFRPSFSTVNGGYGTFGGISSTMVQVN